MSSPRSLPTRVLVLLILESLLGVASAQKFGREDEGGSIAAIVQPGTQVLVEEYRLLFDGAIRPNGGLQVLSVTPGGPATRLLLRGNPAVRGILQPGDVVSRRKEITYRN